MSNFVLGFVTAFMLTAVGSYLYFIRKKREFSEHIEEVRKEASETIADLQAEIFQFHEMIDILEKKDREEEKHG